MFHVVGQAIDEKGWQQLLEGITQIEDREEENNVETIEKNEKKISKFSKCCWKPHKLMILTSSIFLLMSNWIMKLKMFFPTTPFDSKPY